MMPRKRLPLQVKSKEDYDKLPK